LEQVLFGGFYDLLDDTATEYNSLIGGYTWTTSGGWRFKLVSTDGVIKQLRVKLNDSPGVGTKYTFKLYVGSNPTALTFDIAGLDTTGGDMVNEVVVTGDDTIILQCVPDGTPTPRYATWTCVFEGDTEAESLISGGSGFALSNVATEYCGVMGGSTNYSITENDHRQIVPTSGTIKNFYVHISFDPGTAPDAYRFTVRLNGATVAQSLIVTITADATSGSDLVHNLVVAAGDVLTMMIEPLNAPSEAPYARWGMTFVADTDGESVILGGSSSNLPDVDTEYHSIVPSYYNEAWTVNENERYHLGQVCTLKKLYILLNGSPGAGNKYDFTIRIGVADSNVVTTVSDAAVTGNSGALEDTVALDEYLSLKVVPTDSPTIRDAYWGFICYIAPEVSVNLLGEFIVRQIGTPVDLFSKFSIPAIYSITGITKDSAGNRLGNCEVALFRTMGGNPPTYLFIKSDMSDANGDYSFTNLIRTKYFVRGQKDGSPNVFDTTDNEVASV